MWYVFTREMNSVGMASKNAETEPARGAPSPDASPEEDKYDESQLWVKISFHNELKRVKLLQKSFAEFLQSVIPFVESLSSATSEVDAFVGAHNIACKYVDEEGDLVHISSDNELKDAFEIAAKYRMVLKIIVTKTTGPSDADKKELVEVGFFFYLLLVLIF